MSHPVCQVCVFTLHIIKLVFWFFLNLLKGSSKMYLQGLGGLLPVFVLFAVLIFCLILSCLGSVCKICRCASCLSPPLCLQALFLLAKIFAPLFFSSHPAFFRAAQLSPGLIFPPASIFCLSFSSIHLLGNQSAQRAPDRWDFLQKTPWLRAVILSLHSWKKTSSAMLWDGAPSSSHRGCSAFQQLDSQAAGSSSDF